MYTFIYTILYVGFTVLVTEIAAKYIMIFLREEFSQLSLKHIKYSVMF